MALTPNAIGGAELTLGGVDSTKFTKALTYIPVVQSSSFWSLTSTQFSVNGKSSTALTKSTTIIFDSGTSNIVFPKATTEVNICITSFTMGAFMDPSLQALYALISPNIKAVGTKGAYGIACSQIGSITASLDFTFKTSSGVAFNLTIPPEELNVGPFRSDPTTCQTLINAQSGEYPASRTATLIIFIDFNFDRILHSWWIGSQTLLLCVCNSLPSCMLRRFADLFSSYT